MSRGKRLHVDVICRMCLVWAGAVRRSLVQPCALAYSHARHALQCGGAWSSPWFNQVRILVNVQDVDDKSIFQSPELSFSVAVASQ